MMHNISMPSWFSERAIMRLGSPDLRKTALLVVDMQIVFVEQGRPFASPHGADIIDNINRLGVAVRHGGGKVVFTRHTATESGPGAIHDWQLADPRLKSILCDPFLKSLPEHRIDPRMDVHDADIVIDKYRFGAFAPGSSDLDQRLRKLGIDTLIIVGEATNCCCETAAREASQLGYKTFVVTDATATITDGEHNAALLSLGLFFADLRSTNELLELMS